LKEKEFKVDNLEEFIDSLKWRHDEAEREEERKELSRQIINIEIALQAADLKAADIKVEVLPEGVLGAYDMNKNQIIADKDLLSDFDTDLLTLIGLLKHEKNHQDGIADKGLCQIRTGREVSGGTSFYVSEQNQAKRTFYKLTIDKALDLYKLDHPEKLINDWVELELKDMRKDKEELKNMREKDESLNFFARKDTEILKSRFKKGAEMLLKKYEELGFSMKKKVKEVLKEISLKDVKK
jgi:hypothetical protein